MNGPRWPATLLPFAAVAAASWSIVPLAIWWAGVDARYFASAWATWGWGSVVAALALALILALTGGRFGAMALAGWRRLMRIPAALFAVCAALVLAALSVLMTLLVFSGNPRNVDGFAQLFQARIFLAGHVWVPPPAELGNFATLQMILGPDHWYSQYPPGQSLVLAAGLAAGAWWLLNPLLAALLVLATMRVARWCAGTAESRLAPMLLCVSPFIVAVAGSEMSHLAAAVLGIGAAAMACTATERRPLLFAAATGAMLGLMVAFRPLDAMAAAIPVALVLYGWCARRWAALTCSVVAGVIATLPTLWFNAQTTGSWHAFGYTALWGPNHSLGFHPVPFGVPLTLTRAIARSGLDLHQVNTYLLDGTLPVLLIVAAGYVAGRRMLVSRDALPFAGAGALILALFFYWHRDVFYGPRFLYSIAPWLVIMLARSLVLLRRTAGGRDSGAGIIAVLAATMSIVVGLVAITPDRIRAYRESTPIFNLHPDRDAAAASITNAVVMIPDGWGSRLIARMWQLGVSVRRSTRIYGAIDACTLEQALGTAERDTAAATHLLVTLDSLASLKRPGRRAGLTADENLRLAPDSLAGACAVEIQVDRRGYYSYAPYLYLNNASLDGPIVWARDLGPLNEPLFRRYAGRRFFRYAPGDDHRPHLLPVAGPGW